MSFAHYKTGCSYGTTRNLRREIVTRLDAQLQNQFFVYPDLLLLKNHLGTVFAVLSYQSLDRLIEILRIKPIDHFRNTLDIKTVVIIFYN